MLAAPLILALSLLAHAQGSSTGSLGGTVTDPAGAVVSGVSVTVRNNATGVESAATTSENGTFNVPALPAGTYTVTFSMRGFKKSVVENAKVDVGAPSSINVVLSTGDVNETVTVVGEGGELLQSQTANVSTTITGRQITELPFTSRDALDLVLLLPGTSTPGRPRTSTVNGLPKGALNITIDGLNVQDNLLKSDDGFFTYIRPRIDSIDEVTLSTATPGAESSGEGAVQVKFVTRGGTNDLHGSLYWYHRNPALNANYWFNNLAGQPRDRVLLNQPGGRVGGPIWIPKVYDGRNKSFFFVNFEEFRLPEQVTRQRNILTPAAEAGLFTYGTGANQRSVNLLNLAATTRCAGTAAAPVFCTSTIDPTVSKTLAAIRASTSQGSVAAFDQNRQLFTFTNSGGQNRYFTTVRFDHHITSKHRLENVWNYQAFRNGIDFLNGVDPAFPGLLGGVGGQNSNRFSNSTGLRSTITQSIVNEARFGLMGGTSLFRSELSPASFDYLKGFSFGTAVGTGGWFGAFPTGLGINNPNAVRSASRRNSPVKQFSDNLTWVKGSHTMSFGGAFTQINTWADSLNQLVPALTFGVNTSDPANSLFVAGNFPGASSTDISAAAALYAVLTGRVTAISGTAYLSEDAKYAPLGNYVERIRQREFGLYGQDSWRVRQNLTLNYGLRYEVQFPFSSLNTTYTQTRYEDVFGISGPGGLFRPGASGGRVPEFTLFKPGDRPYETDTNNFAPSIGFAWSPGARGNGFLKALFGGVGRSVLRGGYSVAFVREGTNVVSSILAANPGANTSVTRSIALGNLPAGTLLRDLTASTSLAPAPAAPTFPLKSASVNDSINVFDPDLKLGFVRSWTFGFQRELSKDTVFEIRYVGNRGIDLWRQYHINEVNTLENHFIDEFRLAQQNLAANVAAGRGNTFRYAGPGTGTSPLPTILAYSGAVNPTNAGACGGTGQPTCAALYNSSIFTSNTFLSQLSPNQSNAQGFALSLFNDAGRRTNALNAGLPANFFIVNPNFLGGTVPQGAWIVDNSTRTWYDAMTIEVRRRMSKGLLVQGNYTFGKSLSNMFASSSAVASNFTTLRDKNLDKSASPFDIRHALKANWIYELPFGHGRAWLGEANGLVDKLAGGWEVHGAFRMQSGSPFNFGNVQLVGMTAKDLQDSLEIRKDPAGIVFYLPEDIIQNTQRAWNTTATGFSGTAPTGRYIAPPGSNGCVQAYAGQCGFANLVLYGPRFVRTDLSVVKKIKFTERANLEFRTEFLNAFNNINFKVGSAGNTVTTVTNFSATAFGRTTTAYQDISTTNDPGARMIQFVLRLNF
jgi:hypothetical protein